MVSQTNAAGTSARPRRRSTPTLRKQARARKANRYPVSDSDEDKTASSMDSTAPTSPPVDSVDDDSSTQLPTRLFAPGFFPLCGLTYTPRPMSLVLLRLLKQVRRTWMFYSALSLADCFTYLLLVASTQLS
ncbi:hypothetical protein YC2023_041002 [Brassica napus]